MQNTRIGFIGAGNMAGSLIRGLLSQGSAPDQLSAADIDADKLEALRRECGINVASNADIAASAQVIVLAVKPQVMQAVCAELPSGGQDPLYISVAAGITLDQLQAWLGPEAAIVRCMPNTPALVGKGATGLFANAQVNEGQRQLAEEVMNAVGLSRWVDKESDLDLVTAVSGSGPAYFFLFMEAMQQAAQDLGMSEELARSLVLQTVAGAAELALHSEVDVTELRRRVTSPGGTTERAIGEFESGGLRQLVATAVTSARDRSIELANESDDN